MIQVVTTDSKKHERVLQISGFVKPSGSKVAKVVNDEGEAYFVQTYSDGTTTCRHVHNSEPCKGHKFTGRCYHVKAVKEATLPTFEEVTAVIEVNALLIKNRELYRSGQWNEDGELTPVSEVMPNEYDILGPTKKVTHTRVAATDPVLGPQGAVGVCGGCGCAYGVDKGYDCKPGFCLWNSFWTEGKRIQEDARLKAQAELQKIKVHNKYFSGGFAD